MAILITGLLLFPVGRIIIGPAAYVTGDIILLLMYGKLALGVRKTARLPQV